MGLFGKSKNTKEKEGIFKDIKVGKEVSFGRQMTNNHWISWKVVDKQGDKYLLHSTYVFWERELHDTNGPFVCGKGKELNWETSAFRKWLNTSFLKKTFTSEERKHIVNSTIKTADLVTNDYLFLPTIEDAERYYKTDEERIATVSNGYTRVEWVTRTPARNNQTWRFVTDEGKIFDKEDGLIGREMDVKGGIHFRVALWVEP